jgi:hypothetical protein
MGRGGTLPAQRPVCEPPTAAANQKNNRYMDRHRAPISAHRHRTHGVSSTPRRVSEAFTCHESQAAPVKQARHQPRRAMQMRENLVNLIPVEHHWQTFRLSRPLNVIQPSDLFLQHLLVKSRAARVAASQTGRPRGRVSRGAKESKRRALRAWF